MKKLTKLDLIKLEGVRALADQMDRDMKALILTAAEISGEVLDEYDYGHSADFVYSPNISVREFIRKVQYKNKNVKGS